jgi:predicted nucleic acid-binding Zn ribbon protein
MKLCPVCATFSPDGVIHCATCGELLDPSFAPRKRQRALLLSVIALVGVFGFLYWRAGGFSGTKHERRVQAPPAPVNPLAQLAETVSP